MVESVLHVTVGSCPLPIVIYLDNIAMYGDTQEQILIDVVGAIKQLASASSTCIKASSSKLWLNFSGTFGF